MKNDEFIHYAKVLMANTYHCYKGILTGDYHNIKYIILSMKMTMIMIYTQLQAINMITNVC